MPSSQLAGRGPDENEVDYCRRMKELAEQKIGEGDWSDLDLNWDGEALDNDTKQCLVFAQI